MTNCLIFDSVARHLIRSPCPLHVCGRRLAHDPITSGTLRVCETSQRMDGTRHRPATGRWDDRPERLAGIIGRGEREPRRWNACEAAIRPGSQRGPSEARRIELVVLADDIGPGLVLPGRATVGDALRDDRPTSIALLRQIFLVQRAGHRELWIDNVGDVEVSCLPEQLHGIVLVETVVADQPVDHINAGKP
jgi:hypothetical protein